MSFCFTYMDPGLSVVVCVTKWNFSGHQMGEVETVEHQLKQALMSVLRLLSSALSDFNRSLTE